MVAPRFAGISEDELRLGARFTMDPTQFQNYIKQEEGEFVSPAHPPVLIRSGEHPHALLSRDPGVILWEKGTGGDEKVLVLMLRTSQGKEMAVAGWKSTILALFNKPN